MPAVLLTTAIVLLFTTVFGTASQANNDLSALCQTTRLEVNELETQLAKELAEKDAGGFLSHFFVSDEETLQLKAWFDGVCSQNGDDGFVSNEVVLPLLAATADRALVRLGHIGILFLWGR